jgi:ABC-type uncharacterized transport system substrate-binding protein
MAVIDHAAQDRVLAPLTELTWTASIRLSWGRRMQRRDFITLLGSMAAWPLVASAQQSESVRRIGVLLGSYTTSDKAGQARIAAFLKTLGDLGWNADRNIRIDYRWGAGDTEQAKQLTLETVQSAPDVIIATSDPVLAQL